MGFDFTKTQLAKIKEKVEELDQEHSDVEGFDFDASEARFMQKLEKKMEDPLVLELRQEFTKAIQKLSHEINEIEMMLRGNLKIQSSESIKDIPAFARKSSKEVMDFEDSMASSASMMRHSYSKLGKKQGPKTLDYSKLANESRTDVEALSQRVARVEVELQKMIELHRRSLDEGRNFIDKVTVELKRQSEILEKSTNRNTEELIRYFEKNLVSRLDNLRILEEEGGFAGRKEFEEAVLWRKKRREEVNKILKNQEELTKSKEKSRKRKKFFWFF